MIPATNMAVLGGGGRGSCGLSANAFACRRNLVLTDLLTFAIDFLVVAQVYSGPLRNFFQSLTTAGDNRDRCQDTRLGQYSYLAHDRLLKFMGLICGFIWISIIVVYNKFKANVGIARFLKYLKHKV